MKAIQQRWERSATEAEAVRALWDQRITGVEGPEGGKVLRDLAETVLDSVREAVADAVADEPDLEGRLLTDRIGDRMREAADGAVPVYNGEIIAAAADAISLATDEPECGPAFDGSPTPVNIIAGNLYDLATRIAHAEAQDCADALDELNAED